MPSADKIVQGLNILMTYKPDGESWYCAAEHDVLYAPGPRDVSEEHQRELKALGWIWHDDVESWGAFT
jgi:hypothetical protein